MPFQFKQFYIDDSACAMKVGTDGIMLGSWSNVAHAKRILDIGTGSGLVALMLAQKSMVDCAIDAIEIDQPAAQQAQLNVNNSPWPQKVRVEQVNLQQFTQASASYDLIVSNPPYFVAGQDFAQNRQTARHTASLDWPTLIHSVTHLLKPLGKFECVIPADGQAEMTELALQAGLTLTDLLWVKTTERKSAKRVLLRFIKQVHFEVQERATEQTLTIHQLDGSYSQAYRDLCRDYYLNF